MGGLVEEEYAWAVEHGLGDFQAADHAAGVLPHRPIGQVFERHEVKGARDTPSRSERGTS